MTCLLLSRFSSIFVNFMNSNISVTSLLREEEVRTVFFPSFDLASFFII